MTVRYPKPESDQGFSCPSGCIAPEACVNMHLIQGLTDSQRSLAKTIEDPIRLEALKIVQGDLGSLAVRTGTLRKTDAALTASCGLWQNARHEVGNTSVNDEELPPID